MRINVRRPRLLVDSSASANQCLQSETCMTTRKICLKDRICKLRQEAAFVSQDTELCAKRRTCRLLLDILRSLSAALEGKNMCMGSSLSSDLLSSNSHGKAAAALVKSCTSKLVSFCGIYYSCTAYFVG